MKNIDNINYNSISNYSKVLQTYKLKITHNNVINNLNKNKKIKCLFKMIGGIGIYE